MDLHSIILFLTFLEYMYIFIEFLNVELAFWSNSIYSQSNFHEDLELSVLNIEYD